MRRLLVFLALGAAQMGKAQAVDLKVPGLGAQGGPPVKLTLQTQADRREDAKPAFSLGKLGADPMVGGTAAPAPGSRAALASEEERACWRWAKGVEKAVLEGETSFLSRALDWQALRRKIIVRNIPEAALKTFMDGARISSDRMGATICAEVKAGAQYKLISVRRQEGRWKALFRVLSKKGSFNYHLFVLGYNERKEVVANDLLVAITGEYFSESMTRVLTFLAAQMRPNAKDSARAMAAFARYGELARQGKKQEAIKVLDELPVKYQQEKWILLARMGDHAGTDEARYAKLVTEAQRRYPNDPFLDLISLDYWIERKNYDRALEAVVRLRAVVGEDAYRDAFEAKLHALKGDLPAASLQVNKAISKEPELLPAYWVKLDVDLGLMDFPSVAGILTILETRFGVNVENIKKLDEFALFLQSEPFQAWEKARTKAPAKETPAGS